MSEEPQLLLDTCAMIFVANGEAMRPEADEMISDAAHEGRLYISPMSAWELGIGVAKGRLKLPMAPIDFFFRFRDRLNANLSAASPDILVSSSFLPGEPDNDPMDRILMATARALDMVLVTRDQPILNYGKAGHLRTLAC